MPRQLEQTTKLAVARKSSGLSREKVCAKAQDAGFSLSCSTLVHFERGIRQPRIALAVWLAKLYESEVEDLFE